MWNVGGMESPKWLGSHPKHIQYGMMESIWNDMDSIWIPHGMWGESKDLSLLIFKVLTFL
jgi:hypothetical protein